MASRKFPKKVLVGEDWHRADIIAELRKAGWSLRKLSQHHGYQPDVLKQTLTSRWPKAEGIIARAIGVTPADIWPSRYPDKKDAA